MMTSHMQQANPLVGNYQRMIPCLLMAMGLVMFGSTALAQDGSNDGNLQTRINQLEKQVKELQQAIEELKHGVKRINRGTTSFGLGQNYGYVNFFAPQPVEVYIDGEFVGNTVPKTEFSYSLPVGDHQVKLVDPKTEAVFEKKIIIKDGTGFTVKPNF